MRFLIFSVLVMFACCLGMAGEPLQRKVGLARVDITPGTPLRLSGYSRRDVPFESVDSPLAIRALAFQDGGGPIRLLVSVDSIGLPGTLVDSIFKQIEATHGIDRADFVLCNTHNHAAPHIEGGLKNLLRKPLNDQESQKTHEYTQWMQTQLVKCVNEAVKSLQPGQILFGEGSVGFAVNRRVIKDGKWNAFGETPDGPVDHRVSVLRIENDDNELLGVVFNYACHCTTLGNDYNQVCGDWAGDAARQLESGNEIVALCTIGCGADANPSPRGKRSEALQHGRVLADEVDRVIGRPMRVLGDFLDSRFGYVALKFELPTKEELDRQTLSDDIVVKRHAEFMLQTLRERKRLPANAPMPITTWQWTDVETDEVFPMVFFGGEVVAQYALRLQKELAPAKSWVSAYANDVFGYVASEAMRSEGGYEVDFSMIYYLLPGRWASGTEDTIIKRVHQMLDRKSGNGPVPADQAKSAMRISEGWSIQLAAAEPLVSDPIHLSFGDDGSLWVVEMGDYPRGDRQGRVKRLLDDDGDGTYDRSVVFCDGLSFPTSAYLWGNGVLVTAAPELIFLEDTDGDGVADRREVLFDGFAKANPQHRVNGFCLGLDGWLYLAGGDDTKSVRSTASGKQTRVTHQDIAIDIPSGRVRGVLGFTQFGRYRNDWGDWFGGDNSHPLRHFALIGDHQRRNSHIDISSGIADLMMPASAPPIFPITEVSQRFNDLFADGRFTSACTHAPIRDVRLRQALLAGHKLSASWENDVTLICEPVHNLVHRAVVTRDDQSLVATRHQDDVTSEWLASTDSWFRPVQAITGPDGAVWVADMYRAVIEHPEWIPDQWQEQINLRAGEDRGRIWRLVPPPVHGASRTESPVAVMRDFEAQSVTQLVAQLASENGVKRDLAMSRLINQGSSGLELIACEQLNALAVSGPIATARLTAISCLARFGELDVDTMVAALEDKHGGVQKVALQWIGVANATSPWLNEPSVLQAVVRCLSSDDPAVRLAAGFSVGQFPLDQRRQQHVYETMASCLSSVGKQGLMREAILSSADGIALEIIKSLVGGTADPSVLLRDRTTLRLLMETAVGSQPEQTRLLWSRSLNPIR